MEALSGSYLLSAGIVFSLTRSVLLVAASEAMRFDLMDVSFICLQDTSLTTADATEPVS